MTNASRRFVVLVLGGAFAAGGFLAGTRNEKAITATATEEQPEEYKNWIELAIGGVITSGDRAQFEQEHRLPGNQAYGGIQDLHLEGTVGKNTQFSVDGHALWDFNDYDITLQLAKPNLGYIKAGYTEFRSWYDGSGGGFSRNPWVFQPPVPPTHHERGGPASELGSARSDLTP